jgi:hypothetical protein
MPQLPLLLALFLASFSLAGAAEAPATKSTQPAQPPGGESRAPSPKEEAGSAFKLPWEMDHEYHFSWVTKRTKAGESSFRLSEVEVQTGNETRKLYLSKFRYTYKKEGISQEGKSETYFNQSWKPVRYSLHKQMSGLKEMTSRQDHNGEVSGGRLVTKIIHNGNEPQALRLEMEAPPEAYLFLNQSMDNWAILVSYLLRDPRSYEARVIYPDLIKVFDLKFTFEKEEPVDLGKGKTPLCRLYSFRDREGQFVGKVWMNRQGQMVLHEQDDLRIYLEE